MNNTKIFLAVIASIGVISSSILTPAFPLMADYFSVDAREMQLLITLFLIGNALGQLIAGPLSDYISQRAVMLGGLILFVIASSGCALADTLSLLVSARFFQGMGSAAAPVLARAIAVKAFPHNRSAEILSYGAFAVGFMSILMLLFSGIISLISWRGCFWLLMLIGLFYLFWGLFALKNAALSSGESRSLRSTFKGIGKVFCYPQFLVNAIAHSLTYGLMYGYIGLFPFILREFLPEITPKEIGMYSTGMILIYMGGTFLAARLVAKRTVSSLVWYGFFLQSVSGFLLCLSPSLPFFLCAMAVFNLSLGITLPMTSAAALLPIASLAAGTASSALGLSYRLSGSLISYGICLMPLAAGFNLGIAILVLSLLTFSALKWVSPREISIAS